MAYEEILTTSTGLSLSGGTLTGKVRLQKGQDVNSFPGVVGTAGYIKVCTIKIEASYQDAPIEIAFARRDDATITRISIVFNSVSSSDPTLKSFQAFGSTTECWLYKSASSTWSLYIKKVEPYDKIDILSFYKGVFLDGITLTWDGTQESSVPSGATQASLGCQVGYALSSGSATKLGTTTVGSATQPIYLNNGSPSVCTYTLAKSVPSDAVFTDTNTTYSAGTALSLSGTTFNHSNYATAGTAGTSSATSGSTLAVPYITVNAQGHVTGYGTHTHTISGFLTTVTKSNVTSALGYTPCRAWTVTVPSGSSGSKAITVSGATFSNAPLIAKSSGTDTDYNKITAVSASANTLTFTLSSATSAALTLIVIETF